ncbi:MAG: adenosylcobinamide-GDP ribazoletransferase [Acidobacteriia bacterium]|nr:adenosylcobinamide-GDP ribazoletransferase [Terriglobia bacterium]
MTSLYALTGFRNCVGFLTRIPVGMTREGMQQAASYMPLFPIVGALIGFLAGASVWAMELLMPSYVAGMLGVGVILLVNGVQHMDGLLDFGDGLMCHGTRAQKLRAMRDTQTGAGGLSLGMVILVTTALGIASVHGTSIIQTLVVSESVAKFSMVVEAWGSKSAHQGMNTVFVNAMHAKRGGAKVIIGLIESTFISALFLREIGLLAVLVTILGSLIIIAVAKSNFGGITGDVMGASNELIRLLSLLSIIGASKWV